MSTVSLTSAAVRPKLRLALMLGGAGLSVYLEGECVFEMWGGQKNREGDPWQRDTLGLLRWRTSNHEVFATRLSITRWLSSPQ